jgi:hypothetical protein
MTVTSSGDQSELSRILAAEASTAGMVKDWVEGSEGGGEGEGGLV